MWFSISIFYLRKMLYFVHLIITEILGCRTPCQKANCQHFYLIVFFASFNLRTPFMKSKNIFPKKGWQLTFCHASSLSFPVCSITHYVARKTKIYRVFRIEIFAIFNRRIISIIKKGEYYISKILVSETFR